MATHLFRKTQYKHSRKRQRLPLHLLQKGIAVFLAGLLIVPLLGVNSFSKNGYALGLEVTLHSVDDSTVTKSAISEDPVAPETEADDRSDIEGEAGDNT